MTSLYRIIPVPFSCCNKQLNTLVFARCVRAFFCVFFAMLVYNLCLACILVVYGI